MSRAKQPAPFAVGDEYPFPDASLMNDPTGWPASTLGFPPPRARLRQKIGGIGSHTALLAEAEGGA